MATAQSAGLPGPSRCTSSGFSFPGPGTNNGHVKRLQPVAKARSQYYDEVDMTVIVLLSVEVTSEFAVVRILSAKIFEGPAAELLAALPDQV